MALTDFGDVPAGSTLPIFFTSHDGATGANEAASNLAVGDILIYKGTSMTQRSSTSGFALIDTDGLDLDGLTGVNGVSIDLSDDTDSGFYAVGSFYNVVLGPITIDTQTVYVHLATFRIVAAEGTAGYPKVDTHLVEGSDATNQIRDSVVDDATRIDASALNTLSSHDPGEAIMGATDLGTGSGLTSLASAANLATLTGYVDTEITSIISSLSTIAGYLDTEVAAILADTNELQGDWTNGGRLDLLLDAIKAVTDLLPDSGALSSLATAAALATVDGNVDSILADTNELQTDLADGGRTDLLIDGIKAKTDSLTFTVAGQVDANALTLDEDEILDDALADSVPADGSLPTVRQALYMIWQFLSERSVSGTTLTVKKADGSTSLMTFTLDSATAPTSITRAT